MLSDGQRRRVAVRLDLPPGEEAEALREAVTASPGLLVVDDLDDADFLVEVDPGWSGIWRVTSAAGEAAGRSHEHHHTLHADLAAEDVLHALHLILAGHRVTAVAQPTAEPESVSPPDKTATILTLRETQVLALLADGASNKVIARQLGISASTTKFHVASVLQKLGARSRLDAVAIGIRLGLVLI